tara:strand:- start:173 stop:463 length:291 start_codon:yes stop_codon:yes gene_type:complete
MREQVEDVEFVEVEEVDDVVEEYDKLPSETKDSIAKIQGKKSIFENAETSTYLLGAALGGGYAVYKGKKVLLGVAFGLITAYFYLEYLDKPSKKSE